MCGRSRCALPVVVGWFLFVMVGCAPAFLDADFSTFRASNGQPIPGQPPGDRVVTVGPGATVESALDGSGPVGLAVMNFPYSDEGPSPLENQLLVFYPDDAAFQFARSGQNNSDRVVRFRWRGRANVQLGQRLFILIGQPVFYPDHRNVVGVLADSLVLEIARLRTGELSLATASPATGEIIRFTNLAEHELEVMVNYADWTFSVSGIVDGAPFDGIWPGSGDSGVEGRLPSLLRAQGLPTLAVGFFGTHSPKFSSYLVREVEISNGNDFWLRLMEP